jgi:hypothetical protein
MGKWFDENIKDSSFHGEGASSVLDTLTVLAVGFGIGAGTMIYLNSRKDHIPITTNRLKLALHDLQDRDTMPEVYFEDGSKIVLDRKNLEGVGTPIRRDWHPWKRD